MTHEDITQWVAAQDWNLRDAEISRQSGVPYAVVRQRRMKAGIPRGRTSLLVRRSTWDNVDWSRSNKEIGAERGVSRQCVSAYRKRFAALVSLKASLASA
jgi:hypothetical protein